MGEIQDLLVGLSEKARSIERCLVLIWSQDVTGPKHSKTNSKHNRESRFRSSLLSRRVELLVVELEVLLCSVRTVD